MNRSLAIVATGVFIAIGITTTMDATGYSMLSALPLAGLVGIYWAVQKFSREEIGLVWGNRQFYAIALLYPLGVLGSISAIAYLSGVIDTSGANWEHTFINVVAGGTIGVFMVMITEEGFFRGWMWAALRRCGLTDAHVLIWTSASFVIWHLSAITLDTGFDIPAAEIPIYLVNASLLAIVFGLLRMASGSVVVASVCHAVWNAFAYALYGFGEKVGALGIESTHIWGPEVGILGLVVNSIAVLVLWFWWKAARQ